MIFFLFKNFDFLCHNLDFFYVITMIYPTHGFSYVVEMTFYSIIDS